MPSGKICPCCDEQTLHDSGSYRECSGCGFIRWDWSNPVDDVGSGKGYKCSNCDNQTLHTIHESPLGADLLVQRCAICDQTALRPK